VLSTRRPIIINKMRYKQKGYFKNLGIFKMIITKNLNLRKLNTTLDFLTYLVGLHRKIKSKIDSIYRNKIQIICMEKMKYICKESVN